MLSFLKESIVEFLACVLRQVIGIWTSHVRQLNAVLLRSIPIGVQGQPLRKGFEMSPAALQDRKFRFRFVVVSSVAIAIALATFLSIRYLPSLDDDSKRDYKRETVDHARRNEESKETPHVKTFSSFSRMSIELSPQAMRNLGLSGEFLRPITRGVYKRTITVPGIVVPKPGRTEIRVASPLNGVVQHVHSVVGEAVIPGQMLFEVRLSHEDLVEAQTTFLKTLGELEVEAREIERLEAIAQSGAISGKTLLDRRYAKERLEASIRSQREGLKLHGFSDRQVDAIVTEGKLLRELQVVAPNTDVHSRDEAEELQLSRRLYWPVVYSPATERNEQPLVIQSLQVSKGQAVVAGDALCSLADFSQLFIEGQAYEQDSRAIENAVSKGWPVTIVSGDDSAQEIMSDLKIAYIENSIDESIRTLSFYVELPNEILRDDLNRENQRFITWKYRSGQRVEIQVPVEEWNDQIVVPIGAVVKDGAEWFVFQQAGKRFKRIPVHLKHRDQQWAVIADDGALNLGDVIAFRSAHQLQMAIQNASLSVADPHAGHSH